MQRELLPMLNELEAKLKETRLRWEEDGCPTLQDDLKRVLERMREDIDWFVTESYDDMKTMQTARNRCNRVLNSWLGNGQVALKYREKLSSASFAEAKVLMIEWSEVLQIDELVDEDRLQCEYEPFLQRFFQRLHTARGPLHLNLAMEMILPALRQIDTAPFQGAKTALLDFEKCVSLRTHQRKFADVQVDELEFG
jgi:hypothetical protein